MKPEKDAEYKYTAYKSPSTATKDIDSGYTPKEFYKEKDWVDIKNELSNKYGYGYSSGGFLGTTSPRHEEESLEERVRRILEKSKQIK